MKIIITGINGRMGGEVARAILASGEHQIIGATVRNPSLIGKDIGAIIGVPSLGVAATPLSETEFSEADVAIDFTLPELLPELLEKCQQTKTALVTGTTGLTPDNKELLDTTAKEIPIVQSGNMSMGVNLLAVLVEQASAALDEDFDIEINELHHRHKKDAPSGTAKLLGEAAAAGRKVSLSEKMAIDRDGLREQGDIGFSVQRGGGVIGDHTVMLAGENERLELTHRGHNRTIYADGALKAAQWLKGQPAGLYSMRDVLAL